MNKGGQRRVYYVRGSGRSRHYARHYMAIHSYLYEYIIQLGTVK